MVAKIVVLLLTKGRVPYTLRAIHSIEANLRYDNFSYYVADGGSLPEEHKQVIALLEDYGAEWRGHSQVASSGENWNRGISEIFKDMSQHIYLRLENDFELAEPLDPTPYVDLLNDLPNVGCIRLGLLPIKLDIHTMGYDGRIYQHIRKSTQYVWSGNPCLVHRRFHDYYGMFRHGLTPGDSELSLDDKVRRKDGPYVWRPNALGDYGPFRHIGEEQSAF